MCLNIRGGEQMMKTFHYMKMHRVARCPCLIIRWYHPGTDSLGGSFFPSGAAAQDGQQIPGGQWKSLSLEELPVKRYLQTEQRHKTQTRACGFVWLAFRKRLLHRVCMQESLLFAAHAWPHSSPLTRATIGLPCHHVSMSHPAEEVIQSICACTVTAAIHRSASAHITWLPENVWHHLPTNAFSLKDELVVAILVPFFLSVLPL